MDRLTDGWKRRADVARNLQIMLSNIMSLLEKIRRKSLNSCQIRLSALSKIIRSDVIHSSG